MKCFSLSIFTLVLAFCDGTLQTKLHYKVNYTHKETHIQEETRGTLITECPRERKPPVHNLISELIRFPIEGCPPNDNSRASEFSCEQSLICEKEFRILRNVLHNGTCLSLGFEYACHGTTKSTHSLLRWGNVGATLTCRPKGEAVVEAVEQGQNGSTRFWTILTTRRGTVHLFIKLSTLPSHNTTLGLRMSLDAVYINAKQITPTRKPRSFTRDLTSDYTSIYLPPTTGLSSNHGQFKSFTGAVHLADVFTEEQNDSQIHDEYRYMELLAGGVPYPECLCPPGTGVEGTDMCSDGTGRLTQEPDQYFLPVTGLYDGIWDSSLRYGYWGAPRTDMNVSLIFDTPALITRLELHLPQQSFTIYSHSVGKTHLILQMHLNETRYTYNDTNPRWEKTGRDFKFVWNLVDWHLSVVTDSLIIGFTGDRYVDYLNYPKTLKEYNMLYEFVIYGREIGVKEDDNHCSCFPGNEQKNTTCEECNRCRCRDGHISRHGKRCAPYVELMMPNFGPASGGTLVTIKGKLLKPQLKLNITVEVFMGTAEEYTSFKGVLYTNDSITYQTNSINNSMIGKQLLVWVDLLLDGVRYRIDQELNFTYLPDPIIEHVTPYRAFLTGGSKITVHGRFLNSVSFHGTNKILTVGVLHSKGECSIQSSQRMICTMPKLEQKSTLRTSIGLELDGVEKYRNLSAFFPDKEFVIFPKPYFYPGEFEYNDGELTLKGENLDLCCSKNDYTILLSNDKCAVINLDSYALVCDAYNMSLELEKKSLQIMVTVDDFKFDLGFFIAKSPVEESEHNPIYIFLATLFVFGLLSVGIILWRWRKRKHNPTQEIPLSTLEANRTDSEAAVAVSERDILSSLNPALQKVIQARLLTCDNIQKHKRIGKGNFGKVFHASISIEGELINVALKTLKEGTSADIEEIEDFLNEATVMKDFQHPNVLSLMGVILNPRDLYVVLPYMINGDLRKYAARQMYDFKTFSAFTLDIARGMEYLSSKRFVHRDLAARNCMVSAAGVVLIGDFGLAKDIYVADYYRPEGRNKPMPFKWMAPECLDERLFTSKSDTWAYGVTVWEVYSQGDRPYPMVENLDLLIHLERGNRLQKPDNCPEPVFQVMRRCWEHNANQRPDFSEIINLLEEVAEEVMKAQQKTTILLSQSTGQQAPPTMLSPPAHVFSPCNSDSQCPLLAEEAGSDIQDVDMPNYPAPIPYENALFSDTLRCEGAVGGVPTPPVFQPLDVMAFVNSPTPADLRNGSSSEDEAGYMKPVRRNPHFK